MRVITIITRILFLIAVSLPVKSVASGTDVEYLTSCSIADFLECSSVISYFGGCYCYKQVMATLELNKQYGHNDPLKVVSKGENESVAVYWCFLLNGKLQCDKDYSPK